MKTTFEAIADLMKSLNDFCFRKSSSGENCDGCCFKGDTIEGSQCCPLGHFHNLLANKLQNSVMDNEAAEEFKPCDRFKLKVNGCDYILCNAIYRAARKWPDVRRTMYGCSEKYCPYKHPELINGHNLEEL